MSTLRVTNLQDTSGNPYKGMEFKGMDLASGQSPIILDNITWHTDADNTVKTIGNPNTFANDDLTDPEVSALIIGVQSVFNGGSTTHTYLTGWIYQDGKDYQDYGSYASSSLFDAYYTIRMVPHIVPWDPSGTQSLKMYVSSAYNSSSSNIAQIVYLGCIKGK